MGRMTQMIVFLNSEKIPNARGFTHFYIDDKAKEIRKKYRKSLKIEDEKEKTIR